MEIPSDNLNKVLSPFVTTKKEGYGLGLAITKHIIESDHGGKLKIKSSPGNGTTVCVTLPIQHRKKNNTVYNKETVNLKNQNDSSLNTNNTKSSLRQHILVVNDDKSMLYEIKRHLLKEGYKVSVTQFGQRAFKKCLSTQIDAIVFDYHLEKDKSETRTAKDFIPQLKKEFTQTPIILTSATAKNISDGSIGNDHFLEINKNFWKKLPPILNKYLLN